eukprot:1391861-Amorphochlora_amoeboformis.AAC.1
MVFLLVVESPGDVRARFFITTHRLLYSWPAGEMYTKIRHPRGGGKDIATVQYPLGGAVESEKEEDNRIQLRGQFKLCMYRIYKFDLLVH